MNEQIQINSTNNLINNISYTSNDNKNFKQDNYNSSLNTQNTQFYSKKKNPRNMSIEELEEYIQKNRAKIKNFKNYESHSLNASFNCNNNLGFFEKIDNKSKNDNLLSVQREQNIKQYIDKNKNNDVKININDNLFNNNIRMKDDNIYSINKGFINNEINGKNDSSLETNLFNNENNKNIIDNNCILNPKLFHNNIEIRSVKNDEIDNKQFDKTLPVANINMNIPSPSFKSIHNSLNYTLNTDNDNLNEIIINKGKKQNDKDNNATKNINQINETITNSTINYIKNLENKIEQLNQENSDLKKLFSSNNNKNNKIIQDLKLYENKLAQLELEKINNIKQNEKEKIFYEKQIFDLKNENQLLKNMLEEKSKELETITKQFEVERNEFIEKMKSLREMIIQKENEKNMTMPNNKQFNHLNKKDINLKNKNIPFVSKKENNKKEINSNNNYKILKEKNIKNKNLNIKTKNKFNYKNINGYKNSKNKTPSKIIKNKIKTGNLLIKNNSKKEINNRRKYEYNNHKCNTNYEEKNNNLFDDKSIFENKGLKKLFNINNKNNAENPNDINNFLQNVNYNDINKKNMQYLNSIGNDFSDEIKIKNNNICIINNQMNESLNNINENIFILERNIPELTREYNNLLNKPNSNLYSNKKDNKEINLKELETQIKESKT